MLSVLKLMHVDMHGSSGLNAVRWSGTCCMIRPYKLKQVRNTDEVGLACNCWAHSNETNIHMIDSATDKSSDE